jgi:mono/diheme cytochrome c family protein
MPQYHLTPEDLDAVTVSLLGMAGTPASGGLEKLVVRRDPASFRPAGEFGDIYARYNCSACHRFNGYGGDLAPDLSYEGSRAQRQWLLSFLKNPQTIRPTLVLRMPQFNMSDREATVIADYLGMVLRFPSDTTNRVESTRFTSQLAAKGKELYEVKYQCQSCHTIGASGGYVGPNLNNAGNWLTPAWVAAWLRNPQAIVPGTIEPRRAFTEDEIQALTAYLMTLKQSNSVPAANRSARKGAAQ